MSGSIVPVIRDNPSQASAVVPGTVKHRRRFARLRHEWDDSEGRPHQPVHRSAGVEWLVARVVGRKPMVEHSTPALSRRRRFPRLVVERPQRWNMDVDRHGTDRPEPEQARRRGVDRRCVVDDPGVGDRHLRRWGGEPHLRVHRHCRRHRRPASGAGEGQRDARFVDRLSNSVNWLTFTRTSA